MESRIAKQKLRSRRGYWMSRFAFCSIILLLVSCGAKKSGGRMADSAKSKTVPGKGDSTFFTKVTHSEIQVIKLQNDSLIEVTVKQGSIPDSISLTLDHHYQQLHVRIFQVKEKDSLVAVLHAPGEGRNLRFNQIQLPDGTLDGPFGHELHYAAKQNGDYTLILGKDNMADGSVKGPVVIYLTLK